MSKEDSSPQLIAPWWLLRALAVAYFALASGTAHAGTSDIVGFYPVAVPAGNSAWVCGLVAKDDFTGSAVTVSADGQGRAVLSFGEVNWTPSSFLSHCVEPHSGISAGFGFDVVGNTETTLTLNTTPAVAGFSAGMVFTLRKHCTLGGLLPDGGGLAPMVDSISLFSASGAPTPYFFNDLLGRWVDGGGNDSHDVVIPAGRGIVIYSSQARTLMFGHGDVCYVKTTSTRVSLTASVPNIVGPVNPLNVDTPLGSLGLTGTLQAFNDSLVILTPGPLSQQGTYLSTGSTMINGLGQNASSTAIQAGAGVVLNVDNAKAVSFNPVTVQP